MSKYISIFFLTVMISGFLYFLLGNVFDGGDYAETAIYTFGTIIAILLSFLIALVYYLINLMNLMNRKL